MCLFKAVHEPQLHNKDTPYSKSVMHQIFGVMTCLRNNELSTGISDKIGRCIWTNLYQS